ncbi:MAG: hypothetical protein GC160_26670 [Acidobacteria bacterium]|nr:hypothetical protein [Acidobacteriota bacterium]
MSLRAVVFGGVVWALAAAGAVAADLRVAAWLTDADSAAAKLEAADFQATVNAADVPVQAALGPGDPLIVIVVLDMVGDLNRIDAARGALAAYIQSMGDNAYVALLQAQDGLLTLQDPTQEREQLVEKLMASSVSGFPGLLDSVEQVAGIGDSMLAQPGVRVAALYLTDGSIGAYRGNLVNTVVNPSDSGDLSRRFGSRLIQEKMSSLHSNLQQFSTPLFFVHLEERTNSQDVAYQNGIMQFATATGGQAWFARGLVDVEQLVRGALARIDAHYSLTLPLPADLTGPAELRLTSDKGAVEHRAQLLIHSASGGKKGKKSKQKRKRGES